MAINLEKDLKTVSDKLKSLSKRIDALAAGMAEKPKKATKRKPAAKKGAPRAKAAATRKVPKAEAIPVVDTVEAEVVPDVQTTAA